MKKLMAFLMFAFVITGLVLPTAAFAEDTSALDELVDVQDHNGDFDGGCGSTLNEPC